MGPLDGERVIEIAAWLLRRSDAWSFPTSVPTCSASNGLKAAVQTAQRLWTR